MIIAVNIKLMKMNIQKNIKLLKLKKKRKKKKKNKVIVMKRKMNQS